MNGKMKKEIALLIVGAVLLAAAVAVKYAFPGLPRYALILIFLVPYMVIGAEIIIEAIHGIVSGQFLDENFLMAAASIGALCIGEYIEAVLVVLLYRLGELLQSIAVGKSRDAVSELMDICPESANKETENGVEEVDPSEVHVGDVFVVRPGEKVPLDGTVIEGSSGLDTAALTGESIPRDVCPGDRIASGCINMSGLLRVRADCEYENSTASRMLELIEGAAANKSKSEKFITKFAKWYTPIVVGLAVLLAVIPPLLFHGEWNEWIYRALNFLVISCPCALVISVPLTFFGGIGAASRRGILAKGSNCLESLANCATVVFDKTGTLTTGMFEVKNVEPAVGFTRDQLLTYTAGAESCSTHPIALCITDYCRNSLETGALKAENAEEIPGHGVSADIGNVKVHCGNKKLMDRIGAECSESDFPGTVIYTAVDGRYAGCIEIEGAVKQCAGETIKRLKSEHNAKTVMLTGDRDRIGKHIAAELELDDVYTELLPEQKVELMEKLISECPGSAAYVGDGINDAPVIARADVGIAMGGLGSDAAIEAADIVIMDDRIEKVPTAISIAKRTVSIAKQNIFFALAVKLIVLVLGALGYAEMWMAIVADVGVCLLAVLNAMRALKLNNSI